MEVRGGGGVGFGGWGRQGVGFLSLRDPGSRCPDHPRWTGAESAGRVHAWRKSHDFRYGREAKE